MLLIYIRSICNKSPTVSSLFISALGFKNPRMLLNVQSVSIMQISLCTNGKEENDVGLQRSYTASQAIFPALECLQTLIKSLWSQRTQTQLNGASRADGSGVLNACLVHILLSWLDHLPTWKALYVLLFSLLCFLLFSPNSAGWTLLYTPFRHATFKLWW